ncbi:MAG TPA: SPFH domain-containing protein, partial [Kofleriaceae bacterium]|nr:SPFH domain-containing protein [Kofleriaceae bacterium]
MSDGNGSMSGRRPQAAPVGSSGGIPRLVRIAKIVVVAVLALWIFPALFTAAVAPNEIGVRTSAVSGVLDEDLAPGWHWRIPSIHKLILLPSSYFMLDYTDDDKGPQKPLVIRTKDNNTVELDVSVPLRIKPGEAHALVAAGNHVQDPDGRFRYQRLAEETTTSVLREEMATLDSVGFYSTDRRLAASEKALDMLNRQLGAMHVQAQAVLVRAVRFRPDYEKQLQA